MIALASLPSVEQGQLVLCRGRHWVVAEIEVSQLPSGGVDRSRVLDGERLVRLSSVEDDGLGDELEVLWELEPGAQVLAQATLPRPVPGRFDDPGRLNAFLDAVRWGAVTSADSTALQAPFRAGITIEDYQLDPVVRALEMPRVNLGIFDDVGLGKTIEAGLVVHELLLRHRARTVWVVCPPNLCLKWQQEMQEKFGLDFRVVDAALVQRLRRERGVTANAFTHFPRLIISLDWIKLPLAQRLLREALPPTVGYPRPLDILVVDEVHQCAPAGTGKYATDSLRTRAMRALTPYFEHRLFLSATPHNGYRESFTALLELLDPQRFARGVDPNDAALTRSIVRRLKSTLRQDPVLGRKADGTPRFPERRIEALEVSYTPDEQELHRLLQEYTASRGRSISTSNANRQATNFVSLLLKKRLFSSPEAFATTLAVHTETVSRSRSSWAKESKVETGLTLALGRALDEDFGDDEEFAAAEADGLAAAAVLGTALTPDQRVLLERMRVIADRLVGKPDAKATVLLEKIRQWCRPASGWDGERLIIFTEYRDTQMWLYRLLDAHGLAGDRVELLYGGMDTEDRERVKREFQADPDLTKVRILLATDAASEGIDLQRHCWRMVHLEIPFNPNRLEQRNGRIDRHLQPSPEVFIYHFVGRGYENAAPGSLAGDLQFLSMVAHKVEQIRDDLGSVGAVLAEQVQDAMLGRRSRLDESALTSERSRRAKAELHRLERNLRERFQALHSKLQDSRAELGLSPEAIERVVAVGLELGRQAPLRPVMVPAKGNYPEVRAFTVPDLTRSWARAGADLYDPIRGKFLPITFDPAAAGRDDVILAHLGHRLVAQSLRLLRAQIWASGPDTGLSRVTARVVADAATPTPVAIAHARLVVTGGDGTRLHEEVIYAGLRLGSGGRTSRIDALKDVRAVLDAPSRRRPDSVVEEQLTAAWPGRIEEALFAALESRADTRFQALRRTLAARGAKEQADVADVLTELRDTITSELDKLQPRIGQLEFDLGVGEKNQLHADVEALRRRLEAIPEEITAEQAQVARRYDEAHLRRLLFPAAVTVIVPDRLADNLADVVR